MVLDYPCWVEVTSGRHKGQCGWALHANRQTRKEGVLVLVRFDGRDFPRDLVEIAATSLRAMTVVEIAIMEARNAYAAKFRPLLARRKT
jgi:hypothetical protein